MRGGDWEPEAVQERHAGVGNGLECGIGITGCDLFEEGDTLEFYHLETAPP